MDSLLSISGLTHTYATGRTAIDGLSLGVQRGEIFGLLGPNGSGKTTLFRILSTLMAPTAGRVTYSFPSGEWELTAGNFAAIRPNLGIVFQSPSIDPELTPYENLKHHGHLYGLRGRALRERIATLLARVSLADRADERVKSFSGGMKRRVEIAKGLLNSPALLLLDEPSTGLDPGARIDLWQQLRQIQSEGVTILVTTHLMEEADLCSRLAIMHRGRCVALGTPGELKAEVGGDVLTMQSPDPAEAARIIEQRFEVKPTLLENTLRVEHPDAPRLIPDLVAALGPALLDSISLSKPTLQDVFIRTTGHRLAPDVSTTAE